MSDTSAISAPQVRTPWGESVRRMLRGPAGWTSFAALALLLALAAFGPILARGEAALVFEGLRLTLLAGASAAAMALAFGVLWGAIAASTPFDGVMMQLLRVVTVIPLTLFVVALTCVMSSVPETRGIELALAIAATQWMPVAVMARGKIRTLGRIAFVDAARAGGAQGGGIFMRHVAPNLAAPLAVTALEALLRAVVAESVVSLLGLGLNNSLGALLGVSARQPEAVLLFWAPLALLFMTVLALTLAAQSLRNATEGAGA